MKKTKTHYVPRQMWEIILFANAVCGQSVETHKHPRYYKSGSTFHKNHVTCQNCRRTKVFRDIK